MAKKVVRPIARSYQARFVEEASRHVRAGGHAVVWDTPLSARLVVRVPDGENPQDLGYWSMLDLGKTRYAVVRGGPLEGLAFVRVPTDCREIVKRRVERDSVHRGPVHAVHFDCVTCAACCRDNNVVLGDDDLERFSEGGRPELGKLPYAKRAGDRMVLVLRRDRSCKHLSPERRCGVYPLRPDACRSFPVASECCLFAREKELGMVDGLEAAT
ncbi:MAG: YkgJ family cysteine cluster protein [Myxococcales bacterium]